MRTIARPENGIGPIPQPALHRLCLESQKYKKNAYDPIYYLRLRDGLSARLRCASRNDDFSCCPSRLQPAKGTDSDVRQELAYVFAGLCSHILLADRRPCLPPRCENVGRRNEWRRALKNGAGLLATTAVNPRQAPVLARRCSFPEDFRLAVFSGSFFERKSGKRCGTKPATAEIRRQTASTTVTSIP